MLGNVRDNTVCSEILDTFTAIQIRTAVLEKSKTKRMGSV
jgi:hypothetical protein